MPTPTGCNCCQTARPGLRPTLPINLAKVDITTGETVAVWSIPYSQVTAVRPTASGLVTLTSQVNFSYDAFGSSPGTSPWRGNGSAMAWDTSKRPTRKSGTTNQGGTYYGLIPDRDYDDTTGSLASYFRSPGGAIDKTGRALYLASWKFTTDDHRPAPIEAHDKYLDIDGSEHEWTGALAGVPGLAPFIFGRVWASLYDESFAILEGASNVAVYDGSTAPFTQTWETSVHAGTYLGLETKPCVASICPDQTVWVCHAGGSGMKTSDTAWPGVLAWAFERVDPGAMTTYRIDNLFPPGYLWFPTIHRVVGGEPRFSLRGGQWPYYPPPMCANSANGLTMCNRSYHVDYVDGTVTFASGSAHDGGAISSLQKHDAGGMRVSDSWEDHATEFQCDQITYDEMDRCFVIQTGGQYGDDTVSIYSQVLMVDDASAATLQTYDVPELQKPFTALWAEGGYLYVGSAVPRNFVD